MFTIAWLFLGQLVAPLIPEPLAREYLAGAILLGAALATVVGVRVEVALRLALVRVADRARQHFSRSRTIGV